MFIYTILNTKKKYAHKHIEAILHMNCKMENTVMWNKCSGDNIPNKTAYTKNPEKKQQSPTTDQTHVTWQSRQTPI